MWKTDITQLSYIFQKTNAKCYKPMLGVKVHSKGKPGQCI